MQMTQIKEMNPVIIKIMKAIVTILVSILISVILSLPVISAEGIKDSGDAGKHETPAITETDTANKRDSSEDPDGKEGYSGEEPVYSEYPRTFIIPKGVCETSKPVMEIRRLK